jgi:hypothetical protein
MYARVGILDAHHQAWIVLRELREWEIRMPPVTAQYAVLNIVRGKAHSAYVVGNPSKESEVAQHGSTDFIVDDAVQDQSIVKIDPESDLLRAIPQVFLSA